MLRWVGRIGSCRIILLTLAIVVLRSQACAAATDAEMAQRYLVAAERNDVQSQVYVAALYSAGVGFKQSDREAFRWFLRAAEQGHAQAQVIVSALYAIGRGVPKSNGSAYRWASRAAEAKDSTIRSGASQLLDVLNDRMSAAQRAEARARSGTESASIQEAERSTRFNRDTDIGQRPAADTPIASHSRQADEYYRRGQRRAQNGEYALAIEDFGKVIELAPNDAEALNNRCWARAVEGRHLREALADCDRALQLRPDFADALDSRGLVNLKLGNLDRAIADFSAVLKLKPRHGSALYGRGIARLRNGSAVAGIADIMAAKDIDPNIVKKYSLYDVK